MKKTSKLMRASGILLALTLITSCFVGGTFAKYFTEDDGEDTARVAKWGVKVDVTGEGFKTTYTKDDMLTTIPNDGPAVEADGSESITFHYGIGLSESTTKNVSNVVAPGTSGNFGGVHISGTPEVAVKVETEATVVFTGWNVQEDGDFYCPLTFTIGDRVINGLDYSDSSEGGATAFATDIEAAIEGATTKVYEAGTPLDDLASNDIQYSWSWPFEGGTSEVMDQDDTLDTLLANNALGEDGAEIPGVMITVTTTVTQVH